MCCQEHLPPTPRPAHSRTRPLQDTPSRYAVAYLQHVIQRQVAEALAGQGQGTCGLLHFVGPVPRSLGIPHEGQLQVLPHFVKLLLGLLELPHIPGGGRWQVRGARQGELESPSLPRRSRSWGGPPFQASLPASPVSDDLALPSPSRRQDILALHHLTPSIGPAWGDARTPDSSTQLHRDLSTQRSPRHPKGTHRRRAETSSHLP